ncbi:MAG: MFS transporter, partial [Spirochaetales bacterium]|nr:MFS transporter [Spirochaetales bacterium]
FYWFMTMYVTPYFALMSELGHTPEERLFLSTLISITWAVGTAIGTQVYTIKGIFEAGGMSATGAFQATIAIFAAVGFLFMLLPILFIDEKRYSSGKGNDQNILLSLKEAFSNRNFRVFTISDLAYWVAMTFASTGLVYYVTVLLKQEEAVTSQLQMVMFLVSFAFYMPVNGIARKTGKKKVLNFGFILFMLVYTIVIFLGKLPLPLTVQSFGLVILLGIPMAIFGILPNAIVGDMAEADAVLTGKHRNAVYYGARTFMSKMGQMIGGLVFPSLLLLGSSSDNDIGIRMTGAVALIFVIAGFLFFLLYNEKEILGILKKESKEK